MKKNEDGDLTEPKIAYIDEKELLDGLLQITGNLGKAHSLLDRVIDSTREEFATTLREIKGNVSAELRRARRRATYRLKKSMGEYSGAKPKDVALHHVVAGWDLRAERALRILLQFGIDPHSAINSAYLPRSVRRTPHPDMPSAFAHSKIHTDFYHENTFIMLRDAAAVPGATKADIEETLRDIARSLQAGTFPLDRLIQGA
jgi:hypothetical protein